MSAVRADPLAVYIDFARLMVERDRKIYRGIRMADKIEIKGLGDHIRRAKAGIAEVRHHAAALGESTTGLSATLQDVKKQVDAAHEDLKFEAQTLGNSPPETPSQPGGDESKKNT